MQIEDLNDLLRHYSSCWIAEYKIPEHRLVLEFHADGGWFEVSPLYLSFDGPIVVNLARGFFFPVRLRIATDDEVLRLVPALGIELDDEGRPWPGYKCYVFLKDGQDTGFYVYAWSIDVHGYPGWWKPGLDEPEGP